MHVLVNGRGRFSSNDPAGTAEARMHPTSQETWIRGCQPIVRTWSPSDANLLFPSGKPRLSLLNTTVFHSSKRLVEEIFVASGGRDAGIFDSCFFHASSKPLAHRLDI
jgi:hypothetical protein